MAFGEVPVKLPNKDDAPASDGAPYSQVVRRVQMRSVIVHPSEAPDIFTEGSRRFRSQKGKRGSFLGKATDVSEGTVALPIELQDKSPAGGGEKSKKVPAPKPTPKKGKSFRRSHQECEAASAKEKKGRKRPLVVSEGEEEEDHIPLAKGVTNLSHSSTNASQVPLTTPSIEQVREQIHRELNPSVEEGAPEG